MNGALKGSMALLSLVALGGCSILAKDDGCTSEIGKTAVVDKIKAQMIKAAASAVSATEVSVPEAKIRSAVEGFKFWIDDVRTLTQGEKSTLKSCTGNFKFEVGPETIANYVKALEFSKDEGIENLALEKVLTTTGTERSGNTFAYPIDYTVQPTDDGAKVIGEIADIKKPAALGGLITFISLMAPQIEQEQKAAQQRATEAKESAERARAEQRVATLAEAREAMDLSNQSIGATWQGLDRGTRGQLLPLQRAWITRKTADCKVEAAETSLDPQERETARMRCETRMNNDRQSELQNADYGY